MSVTCTLVLNAGSSSLKFRLYEGREAIIDGSIDRIGERGTFRLSRKGHVESHEIWTDDHKSAGLIMLRTVAPHPIGRVVHRIVHGGSHDRPERITRDLLVELWELIPLAPLHLPPALELVELTHTKLHAEHIACFDTMFHRDMPDHARLYALPRKLARDLRIERYGFHGLAHAAMLRHATHVLGERPKRLVTCQFGNGNSACAILDGRSVDTTMGFTPLEGIPMGTRSGSIDPAIVPFLCENGMSTQEVERMLTLQSGLFGLAGSADCRDLLQREQQGDKDAILALDLLSHHARKAIASMTASLGGLDVLVLSGGLMHAPALRMSFLQGLDYLGVDLDPTMIGAPAPATISSGKVIVLVADADEMDEMLSAALSLRRAPVGE